MQRRIGFAHPAVVAGCGMYLLSIAGTILLLRWFLA